VNVEPDDITSLPDLVAFNARQNPDHVFCIQAQSSRKVEESDNAEPAYQGVQITFSQLGRAIHSCANWLSTTITTNQNSEKPEDIPPVALYQESDVGLFIHLVALQSLNIPVCSTCSVVIMTSC
jgi:acyl-CoA synthetase (AMP-forming)/AMP-acid ligase II